MFLRSLFVFSGVCIAHSLVFYLMFLRSLFVFSGVCIAHSLVFYVMFLRSLFVFSGVVYCSFFSFLCNVFKIIVCF